ncbi:hemagglutinin repeat-containing protein, partial [Marinomonas transparens]
TVGVKNAYVDVALAAKSLKDALEAVKDAKSAYDDAKQKVDEGKMLKDDLKYYEVNIAAATKNAVGAQAAAAASIAGAAAAASTSFGTGFYASAGASTQKTTNSTVTTQSEWNGSSINVGGNSQFTADNNINVEGSSINTAGALALEATNIDVFAGKNTLQTSNTSHSEGVSASVGTNGGISGSINTSDSESQSNSTEYINSQISAGSLASNSESLTLKGGSFSATDIDISTDKLVVESLQNTATSQSESTGFNLGGSYGGEVTTENEQGQMVTSEEGASGNIGANSNKSSSNVAWVDNQSGILGNNVNITAKETRLTGGLIAAVDETGQDNGQLTFTTDTLVTSDIQDTDNSESTGINLSTSPTIEGSTTVQANYQGHDKAQTTASTIGQGLVRVGGQDLDQVTDQQVNRDVNNSQRVTKDLETGGLDASVTVDNESIVAAGVAVADAVDYVADEIAVLGNDLPEELREQLGEKGEILYDSLIRSDVSEEERIALLEKEDLVQYLASEEVLKNAPEEEVTAALDNLKDRAGEALQLDNADKTTEAFTESEILASSDMPETRILDTLEVTGSYPDEPDILQKATDGLGRAAQVVDQLAQENPQTAGALSTALGLVTGGVVREGIAIAVGAATEIAASQSETVRDALGQVDEVMDHVTNIAANIIYDSGSVEDFVSDVDYEVTNPDDRPTELGASATGVKGGVATGVTLASIVVGVGGSKKGSTDNKGSGSNETSGVGSGAEDNISTRSNSGDAAVNGSDRVLWGNWNDYSKQVIDTPNGPQNFAVIGDRLYSEHAVARMQPSGQRYSSGHASSENHNPTSISPSTGTPSWADGIEPGINVSDGTKNLRGRSISPSYVEDIIKNNHHIKQPNGNLVYEGGSLNVIVSPDNKRVISIINVD